MKFLHKISVTTILGLLSIPTYAVPNVWTSSFTQGYTEYVLSNSKNQTIIVACNEYADIHSDHGFYYYPKGLNGNSLPLRNISILFDNSTVAYPPQDGGLPTSTRGGANEWINFTRAISKAKKLIYIQTISSLQHLHQHLTVLNPLLESLLNVNPQDNNLLCYIIHSY